MSAVTAVPLRPLAPRAVLKLWLGLAVLVIAAVGLGWWGTRAMQPVTLDSGVRIQAVRPGSGATMAAADVIAMRFEIHVNSLDAPVFRDSGAQPFVGTVQDLPAGFAEGVQSTRAGGHYVIAVPVRVILAGQPLPPRADFTINDTLLFDTQVLQIQAGQASAFQMQRLQQMMQQQQMMEQGGPPGAGPHGAPAPAAPPPPAGGR